MPIHAIYLPNFLSGFKKIWLPRQALRVLFTQAANLRMYMNGRDKRKRGRTFATQKARPALKTSNQLEEYQAPPL